MLLRCIMKIPRSSRDSTQLGLILCLIVNDAYRMRADFNLEGWLACAGKSRDRDEDDYEFAETVVLEQWNAEERRGGGDR